MYVSITPSLTVPWAHYKTWDRKAVIYNSDRSVTQEEIHTLSLGLPPHRSTSSRSQYYVGLSDNGHYKHKLSICLGQVCERNNPASQINCRFPCIPMIFFFVMFRRGMMSLMYTRWEDMRKLMFMSRLRNKWKHNKAYSMYAVSSSYLASILLRLTKKASSTTSLPSTYASTHAAARCDEMKAVDYRAP